MWEKYLPLGSRLSDKNGRFCVKFIDVRNDLHSGSFPFKTIYQENECSTKECFWEFMTCRIVLFHNFLMRVTGKTLITDGNSGQKSDVNVCKSFLHEVIFNWTIGKKRKSFQTWPFTTTENLTTQQKFSSKAVFASHTAQCADWDINQTDILLYFWCTWGIG